MGTKLIQAWPAADALLSGTYISGDKEDTLKDNGVSYIAQEAFSAGTFYRLQYDIIDSHTGGAGVPTLLRVRASVIAGSAPGEVIPVTSEIRIDTILGVAAYTGALDGSTILEFPLDSSQLGTFDELDIFFIAPYLNDPAGPLTLKLDLCAVYYEESDGVAPVPEVVDADQKNQALLLADHLPQGLLWSKKYDVESNIGKLVSALAVEFFMLEQFQNDVATEWVIGSSVEWLSDWEASVGLPNACLEIPTDIDDRRALVKAMLTNFGGVQTKEEYENAGALLGYDVTVIPGSSEPGSFGSAKEAANSIIIELNDVFGGSAGWPAPFPMTFGLSTPSVIRCFYESICPATDQIVIRQAT